jgi:hypothetical protein
LKKFSSRQDKNLIAPFHRKITHASGLQTSINNDSFSLKAAFGNEGDGWHEVGAEEIYGRADGSRL